VNLLHRLEQLEEGRGLTDPRERDAEGLDLHVHVGDVDDLVPDEALEEDADQTDQAVLSVAVLDVLAARHAVGDEAVDELGMDEGRGGPCLSGAGIGDATHGKAVDDLHAVQAHVHADEG